MDLLATPSNYERKRGNVPELPVINLFAETIPSENKVIFQSRPGLDVSSTISTDPVRAMYQEANVFSGSTFVVIDMSVYRDGVLIGTIDGTGPVSFDSYSDTTFISAGGRLWKYNGSAISEVGLPDGFSPLRIVVAASRLVVIDKGTQKLYWSNVLTDTVDALSFAEAESSPDLLLDMLFIGDTLVLFGQSTIEFWTINADPDAPFVPILGRVFAKGLKNTGACSRLISSNAFAWITETDQICINDPTNIISDSELEIRIGKADAAFLWTFNMDQSEYLAVRLPTETWIFSPSEKGVWTKFETYGEENWEPCCYAGDAFGSGISGRLLTWSETYQDDGYDTLTRSFRVWAPISTQTVLVSSVVVAVDSGTTTTLTGDLADPTIEMRTSRDGGSLWSNWKVAKLGAMGKYRRLVRWLSNGLFSYPGIMLEFRVTDPVPFRVSHVYVNEPYGGY